MFKFSKKTRVTVPGSFATQGVVVDATESLVGFPVYVLRWLTEAGETMTGSCGEGDLAAANNLTHGITGGPASAAEKSAARALRIAETVLKKSAAKRKR